MRNTIKFSRASTLPALLVLTLLSLIVAGQSTLSSITGVVTDATGATLPGAEVTITNTATGAAIKTRTNDEGVYVAPSLRPDAYRLEVKLQGFKTTAQQFTLQAAQNLRLDLQLEPGDIVEVVQVESTTAPLLTRESAEIATSISARQIQNLPLKGRSPYGALTLVPGLEGSSTDPSGRNSGTVSINGSRALNTQVTIDGINIQAVSGIGERVASIDALQEVKVLTGTYSAEYAQTQGGSILFQVKSGGKDFHGSLFAFHQNSAFNANEWANNARGIKATSAQRTEAGGTIGGPLTLPRFGEGGAALLRDKAFFFGSYEGTTDRNAQNRIRTIPPADIRGGDFSRYATRIIDPLTGAPFPGNIIPVTRLDPAAVRLLQLLPAPNQTGNPANQFGVSTDNYILTGAARERQDFFVARFDLAPTERDKIYFTYRLIKENQTDTAADFLSALNTVQGPRTRTQHSGALGYTHVFSPTFSNEFLLTAYRDNRVIEPYFGDFDVRGQLGIARRVGSGLPTIDFTGTNTFNDYGASLYNYGINQHITGQNIMTLLAGKHTLRFGAQLYNHQEPYFAATNAAGAYRFSGEVTGNGAPGRNHPLYTFADFLLGQVRTAVAPAPQLPANRTSYDFGVFAQDDFKVAPRLTLNLGLRYEFEVLPTVRNNVFSRIDPLTGELLVAGRNATRKLNREQDYLNFSPRLGLAYSFNDKTVVRAGYGIVHGTTYQDYGPRQQFTGFSFTQNYIAIGANRPQPFTFSQGFPINETLGQPDPLLIFAAATEANPLAIQGPTFFPEDPRPYVMQWSLSVQREIGWGTVVDVAYVGTRGVHLSRIYEGNNPGIDRAAEVAAAGVLAQRLRPFPRLGAFVVTSYGANSNYNSLQTKLERRLGQGLSVQVAYTFAKNIDDASNGFGRGEISANQIPWQFPQLERALSDIDRTHNFNASVVYDLPFGRGRRFLGDNRVLGAIVGGFQFNALIGFGNGLPLTITQNRLNLVLNDQRPNVRDASNLSGRLDESLVDPNRLGAVRYLIPANDPRFPFERSSATEIGSLGRNTVREPGYKNLNLSLFREFRFTEQTRLQARLEAFNALNLVNLGAPVTNIDNAEYGLITSARPARVLQVGLRLRF